jgi:membrane protein DedA with SNARE-associated domain
MYRCGMMYELFLSVVELVESWGYLGIFIMTFIESTFVPIPAEITLIPAGYIVHKGEMNFYLVWLTSVIGTLGGSLCNYYIAYFFGRRILVQYGKYFFINEDKLKAMEYFMERHGSISMFSGRLLPGVKHFISFPAGLGKMDIKLFCLFTTIGGAIWCGILIWLGYVIGENEHLIAKYLKQVNFILFVLVVCIVAFYVWKKRISTQDAE